MGGADFALRLGSGGADTESGRGCLKAFSNIFLCYCCLSFLCERETSNLEGCSYIKSLLAIQPLL